MTIHWDESLRLGHATIDIQHMEIFSQIDKLSEKITEGADNIEIRNLLGYLHAYSNKHFFDEEKLMAQYNYYGTYKQKREHEKFKNEIEELTQMLRKKVNAIELAHRIEKTLIRYFIDHVSVLDQELALFIKFQREKAAQEG